MQRSTLDKDKLPVFYSSLRNRQTACRVDMGVTLTSALAIIIGNLLADLVAPVIDPRIRTR